VIAHAVGQHVVGAVLPRPSWPMTRSNVCCRLNDAPNTHTAVREREFRPPSRGRRQAARPLSLGTSYGRAVGIFHQREVCCASRSRRSGQAPTNVLTYGMGYHQQRYSPLKQISKSTVKRLVPVWSASLANEFGEQGQRWSTTACSIRPTSSAWSRSTLPPAGSYGRQRSNGTAVARVVCCGLPTEGWRYNGKLSSARSTHT